MNRLDISTILIFILSIFLTIIGLIVDNNVMAFLGVIGFIVFGIILTVFVIGRDY